MSREIAMPDYVGAKAIVVQLSSATPAPTEGQVFVVEFDFSRAETEPSTDNSPTAEGPALPLVVQLIAPSGRISSERVLDLVVPDSADFIADEGGAHLVRIAERYHNRWFGSLVVDVVGSRAED